MAQDILIRQCIADFAFPKLFNALGWDNMPPGSRPQQIEANNATYTLTLISEKKGLQVFTCSAAPDGSIPRLATRKKISRKLATLAYEHLIIFVDAAERTQQWQWIVRAKGQPQTPYGAKYTRGQDAIALTQKLHRLSVTLDEDARLGIVDMTARAQAAFKANEDVTKKFYPLFRKQYEAFLGFIKGIADDKEREWYASLMLNRLMFVYFIQSKGFLANDTDYLRHQYDELERTHGKGHFFDFYRAFLLRLFHDGLATRAEERNPAVGRLIGDVPYLNGGLFEPHDIERRNDIRIPDEAFDAILTFFDGWTWHLDTRPDRSGREINPDVLGYIFEQFINRKQMGAYYTKEDITGYIARNTIIPWFFDAAQRDDAIAFRPDGEVWRWLRERPDDYLYAAVTHGVVTNDGAIIPLPVDTEAGIDDVAKRSGWNRPAPAEYGLPTETWREHLARRQRCLGLRERLANGQIAAINDLITENLDIQTFAQDVLIYCESPDLLRAFYDALTRITVLDPTCGSGAFLFAALNVLAPLYQACLEGMRRFVDDGTASHAARIFSTILAEMDAHPNADYFVTKTIIVKNLYGVDIMPEAVETCKVRLFLRLASQLERGGQIEPLPDIDFNVRAGNTLVGYASEAAFRQSASSRFSSMFGDAEGIIRQTRIVDGLLNQYRMEQMAYAANSDVTRQSKAALKIEMDRLSGQLDQYLAAEYGIVAGDNAQGYEVRFAKWHETHLPFHWFSEFYGVMQRGGFDVVIGNPPYVLNQDILYTMIGYSTLACGDIYAQCVERALLSLMTPIGRFSMIIPISSVSTDGYKSIRDVYARTNRTFMAANFGVRPSKLFEGVDKRLTILTATSIDAFNVLSTPYRRWVAEERPNIFQVLSYQATYPAWLDISGYPKIGSPIEGSILGKIASRRNSVASYCVKNTSHIIRFTRKLQYFIQFFEQPPRILDSQGRLLQPSELKEIHVLTDSQKRMLLSALNSSLFFWFFIAFSDCRNVNLREILQFRIDTDDISREDQDALASLTSTLLEDFQRHAKLLSRNDKRAGQLLIESFQPRNSKVIIDKIDRVLARHYGFTDEELDYLINYDIKYRMGQESDDNT